jgi:hypothetical protein
VNFARFVRPASLRVTTVTAYVSVGLVILVDALLIGMLLAARSHSTAAMTASAHLRESAKQAKETLNRLGAEPHHAVAQGSVATGMLEKHVDGVADGVDCTVTSFEASGESSQFVTHYAKNTTDVGWQQTPVRTELQGNAPSCFTTLGAFESSTIPVELDTLEFDRVGVSPKGKATISVAADLRVLVWAGAK